MAGTSQVIKRLLSCHINSKILFSSIRSASNLESHLQAWQSTSACCKAIELNYLHRIVVENCLNLSNQLENLLLSDQLAVMTYMTIYIIDNVLKKGLYYRYFQMLSHL